MELVLYATSVAECAEKMKNPNAKKYIIVYDEKMEEMGTDYLEKRIQFQNLKKMSRELGVFLISYKELCDYVIASRRFRFGHI